MNSKTKRISVSFSQEANREDFCLGFGTRFGWGAVATP